MRKRETSVMMSKAAITDHWASSEGQSCPYWIQGWERLQRRAVRKMDMNPIVQHPPRMLHATTWCMRSAVMRLKSSTTQILPA